MTSQEDCYFFFNSTCTKGDDCAFRHEQAALGNNIICEQWKNGTCNRNPCNFRHGIPEAPVLNVPCYYENSPTGCLNIHCQYVHRKPRPFFTGFQAPRPPAPAVVHPRLSNAFSQRFPPPHNQRFRGPPSHRPSHRMEYMPRKIDSAPPHPLGPPSADLPPRFPNHPREPARLPNFQNMRPRLFHEQEFRGINPVIPGQNQPRFEPRMESNEHNRPPFRPPFLPNENRPMSVHESLMPSLSSQPRPHPGQGILGEPPLSLAFGGMIPFNIPSEQISRRSKKNSSGHDSKVSRSRSSSKRTVKKLDDKRRRKYVKSSDERDAPEARRRKKEKISSRKGLKDSSSRSRKVRRRSTSKESREREAERHSPHAIFTTKAEAKDSGEVDRVDSDGPDGSNLTFKVKTLEEILRNKALKKLRERQETRKATEQVADTSSMDENHISKATEDNTQNTDKLSVPKEDETTVGDEIPRDGTATVGKSPCIENNQQKSTTTDLTEVKVKSLDEIRREKLAKLSAGKSDLPSKNDPKASDRILKPLKPLNSRGRKLAALGRRRSGGISSISGKTGSGDTSGNHGIGGTSSNHGIGGTSSNHGNGVPSDNLGNPGNQASGKHNQRPLPPLRKLTKSLKNQSPLSETQLTASHKKTSPEFLKRKLEQQTYRKLVKSSRRLMSTSARALPAQEAGDTGGTSTSESSSPKRPRVLPEITRCEMESSGGTNETTASDKEVKNEKSRSVGQHEERTNIKPTNSSEKVPASNNTDVEHRTSLPKEKAVKTIKLKRIGVTDRQDATENQGGSRNVLSALGRKIKVKRKICPKTEDLSQEATIEGTNIESNMPKRNVNKDTTEENPIKEIQERQTSEKSDLLVNQRDKNVTPVLLNVLPSPQLPSVYPKDVRVSSKPSITAVIIKNTKASATILPNNSKRVPHLVPSAHEDRSTDMDVKSNGKKSSESFVSKNVKVSSTSVIKSTSTSKEKSEIIYSYNTKMPVKVAPTLSDNPAATFSEVDRGQPSTKVEVLQSEESLQRKSSLDRLVKEVSDDINSDDDELLDEELKKAIAEMSPVATDDEDEVLNADDLLLEIEEMINS